jgi:glyoxylase-like metal-dependent hydrolase (beta-lactamase superfamily II)
VAAKRSRWSSSADAVPRPRELWRGTSLFAARTPTLPPATDTNSYALGARDVVLVEPATPYADEQRAWIEWARALPSMGRKPLAIVATHHHPDHVGGVDVLVRELALPLWAHAETARRIEVPVARPLADGDAIVLEGPTAETWRVLHTPGHAQGHVCLWNEDERTLVVGDMVASVGTILIAPDDGDMRVYLEQLERLARLDARIALPAHGDPIDEPTALFRRYIAHRTMREAKVLAAVAKSGPEGRTAAEIVPDAYDDVGVSVWPIAWLSVRAHLVKLAADGRVRADGGPGDDATVRYSASP